MTIAVRSSTQNFGFGSVVINKPAGAAVGDVLYAVINNRSGTAVPTAPSGWSNLIAIGQSYHRLYRRVVDGSEGANFTWTTTGSDTTRGVIICFSGADTTTPEDVTIPGATSSVASTTVTAPSITTVTGGAAVVHAFAAQYDSSSSPTAPGDTLIQNAQSVGALYSVQGAAGASGTKVITFSASGTWYALTFAVRPASGVDPVAGAPDPTTSVGETHDSSSVSLTWTNPGQSDFAGTMIRRAAGSTAPATATDGTLVSDVTQPGASASDTGLTASTTYSYSLFAHDGSGNYAAPASVTVTTNASAGAPSPVTSLVHSESAVACSLTWTNPVGGSFTGTMVRRATGTVAPSSSTVGTLVQDLPATAGVNNRVNDQTLSPNTTYSYAVFAHDSSGNYAAAATATITTLPSGSAPSAGSRPAAPRPAGVQRLTTDGVFVPAGRATSKQGERTGFMPGPSIASRAPHYRNPFFITGVTSQTSRITHVAMCASSEIRLVYGNYEQSNTGNDITVRAGLELSGGYFIGVTFNGLRDVIVPNGTQIMSDPIPIDLVEGQRFWTRTRATVTSGQIPSNIIYSDSANGEGRDTSGNDLTTSGSITASGFISLYGPCYIAGIPSVDARPVPMVGLIGDSIMASESPYSAYEARLANAHIPHVNMARSGETATFNFDRTNRQTRLRLLNALTHAIVEYGVNDLSTYTLAQIKVGLVDVWRIFALRGVKVYQTTVTPHTTSTDGWTTLGSQTPDASETSRTGLNDWIRAGAPLDPTTKAPVAIGTGGALLAGQTGHYLLGYFEIADTVESARNSGKWALNAGTVDGLHPGQSGQNLMMGAVDITKFAPAP